MAAVHEINGWGTGNQWLGPKNRMLGVQEINVSCPEGQCMGLSTSTFGAQETNGWCPGNQWVESNKLLRHRKQMVGVQEINGWGPGLECWLRPRKPIVGVQKINSGGLGNQCLGPSGSAGGISGQGGGVE